MGDFWREMHWELEPTYQLKDGTMVKDLYQEVRDAFQSLWYVLLYVLCMIPLGFHLSHGFKSAFQSLGLNHAKYNQTIYYAGLFFCIVGLRGCGKYIVSMIIVMQIVGNQIKKQLLNLGMPAPCPLGLRGK